MVVSLMPRLTALGVSRILDSAGEEALDHAAALAVLDEGPSMLSWAASGGSRSDGLPRELATEIRSVAEACGFPSNTSLTARAKFDQDLAVYLGSHSALSTGESLRNDVWAYLTTVMLPEVVAWRFVNRDVARFGGGVRNTFQRLWVRGSVLDRGPSHPQRWDLVRGLSEDASVAIFERSSISGNASLARAMATAWMRVSAEIGRARMEPVMRSAVKLVRLRNEVIDLAGLSESELDRVVARCFDQSLTLFEAKK